MAHEFAAEALVFLASSQAFASAKRDLHVREMDVNLRANAPLLLSFAFRSGLVDHVMLNVFDAKHGITLPFATFAVLALSRALLGKHLSGKKFDVVRSFNDMHDTLSSEDGKTRFRELVDDFGDGKKVEDEDGELMERTDNGVGNKEGRVDDEGDEEHEDEEEEEEDEDEGD